MKIGNKINTKIKYDNHPMQLQCILRRHGYVKVSECGETRTYQKVYANGIWGDIVTKNQKVIGMSYKPLSTCSCKEDKVEIKYIMHEAKQIADGNIKW